jgi:hypothetical protein
MTYHYYHAETGILHPKSIATDLADERDALTFAEANAPPGHVVLQGAFDHRRQRVDVATGAVVPYSPPTPSADHEWDEGTWAWRLNARAIAKLDALEQLKALDSAQLRPLLEHALGIDGAKERLQAIAARKDELRKKL